MNSMDKNPDNMTRVLLISDDGRTFETAFYKDGMFQTDDDNEWYRPHSFEGWMSIKEVKQRLGIN